MNNLKIVLFILFFHNAIICADVIPDNKKKISYSFEITNIDSYPDYTFIAYPVNFSNGIPDIHAVKLSSGREMNISCKFSAPQVFAVKNTAFNSTYFDSLESIQDDAQRNSKLKALIMNNKEFIPSLKISCSNYADKDEKYYYVKDEFTIESIKADTVLINTKTIYKDPNKNIIDAKDSKMKVKEDLVTPEKKFTGYLFIIIPVLALVSIVSVILIRKMKK